MINNKRLHEKIHELKKILFQMINSAKKQDAKNFEMLYTLNDALNSLEIMISNSSSIEYEFKEKWNNNIMWWISRVFEGTLLLELIKDIDKEIQ